MTNAELAAYLNAELNLTGAAAVTPNVIRQWVLWDVLPKSSGRGRGYARGRDWDRSERDRRRALQLARWRATGVTREQALIVHAFIAWGSRDWQRVRDALQSEMSRATALIHKRLSSELAFHAFADVSAARKRAFRNQLGPLDSRLAGTAAELPAELYAIAAQAMLGGDFDRDRLFALTQVRVAPLVPNGLTTNTVPDLLIACIAGLFSSPDESDNSAIRAIALCSRNDFRLSRILISKANRIGLSANAAQLAPSKMLPRSADLKQIEQEIGTGYWQVAAISAILKAIIALR